jgi:chromosome segregation protein
MRLKKIKLAGFKSFVDPTTIQFPSNLLGIVGPNGCGKSNVIDAVRWVMGESSAKTLRGESMADVIFSGSNTRKPVGAASVELIFDNSQGMLGGQYANYNEVAVKRQVSRDGTSQYFLNSSRCRRRDITDIFLGTGLGARSYAIIEQGMVSKLIEAKPEELRIYLEEAAGISKYKERRRETENRSKHTRENLDRLTDLREELEKQLNHLKRQASAAEKYKGFKQQERQLKAELLALRWKGLDDEASQREQTIKERENIHESAVADQREVEALIEKTRAEHAEAGEVMNAVQGRYYQHGSEITRLEAAIKHARESRLQQEQELQRLQKQLEEVSEHLDQDGQQLKNIENQLEDGEPRLVQIQQDQKSSKDSLEHAESAMRSWQVEWEKVSRDLSLATQSVQVETTRIDHIHRNLDQSAQRLQSIQEEQTDIHGQSLSDETQALLQEQHDLMETEKELQASFESTTEKLSEQRADNASMNAQLDEIRGSLQEYRAELATLNSLQKAAFGGSNEHVTGWLQSQNLTEKTRLAQDIKVESGWERAVEAVLGHYLEAVCVDDDAQHLESLNVLEEGRISLIGKRQDQQGPQDDRLLVNRIQSSRDIDSLLSEVYAAENLAEALSLRKELSASASVVTKDGICLGRGWVRIAVEHGKREGMLQREQHIKQLELDIRDLETRFTEQESGLEKGREQFQQLEVKRDEVQHQINNLHRRLAELSAEISGRERTMQQMNDRAERLINDVESIRAQLVQEKQNMGQSQDRLKEASNSQQQLENRKRELDVQREELVVELENTRAQYHSDSDRAHQVEMLVESLKSQQSSIQTHHERMLGQFRHLEERKSELEKSLGQEDLPLEEMEQQREQLLDQRQNIERELGEARKHVEQIDHQLRELDRKRHSVEQEVQEKRLKVEQSRMAWQEIKVRCQGIAEQLQELGLDASSVLQTLNPEASEQAWIDELAAMERRISRLGPINLAAIDEYKTQSERKEYLDRQNDDLTQALETLEAAMRKIDRETRTRFKDTYDSVNAGMKRMFPRLFGGGHGYLELTGDDLLETGVSVMARPPGKRNTSIHLLSGGEKAMTAVALLFSMFQLNPAPFCMLDEIDAPLDDANVGRFCEVVREMSDKIQFIVVTHSKMTMEMVHQLTGVTMQEPGVSRLVAVDIDEAVQMAAV